MTRTTRHRGPLAGGRCRAVVFSITKTRTETTVADTHTERPTPTPGPKMRRGTRVVGRAGRSRCDRAAWSCTPDQAADRPLSRPLDVEAERRRHTTDQLAILILQSQGSRRFAPQHQPISTSTNAKDSPTMLRLLALLVAALALACTPAEAARWGLTVSEADLMHDSLVGTAAVNDARRQHGLPILTADLELQLLAQQWSAEMLVSGMRHDDPTRGVTQRWSRVGENVAAASTIAGGVDAMMESPAHRAIILDPRYSRVGFGVAWSTEGVAYMTVRMLAR